MRCRLTPRTPAAEADTMIGNAVRNSNVPLERSPVPSQRISRIMYDSGGSGRIDWMIQSSAAFATRLEPIHSPSGTPIAVAAPNPPSSRPNVAAMFSHSVVPR